MSQLRDTILNVITNQKNSIWITPRAICENIQCPPDIVQDCLADLETEGMIASWENEDEGIVVTLTPLGAQRLHVHIVEQISNKYSWGFEGDPVPPLARPQGEKSLGNKALIDGTPPPDVQAMMSEEIGMVSVTSEKKKPEWKDTKRFDALPYPTVLLGIGIALWDNIKHPVCPGCNNKPLTPYEYCLRCDRWGMDNFIENTNPSHIHLQTYVEKKTRIATINHRIMKQKKKDKINVRYKS